MEIHAASVPDVPAAALGSRSAALRWDRRRCIDAMLIWREMNGELPVSSDWLRAGPYWPSCSTVKRNCGSWQLCRDAAARSRWRPRELAKL